MLTSKLLHSGMVAALRMCEFVKIGRPHTWWWCVALCFSFSAQVAADDKATGTDGESPTDAPIEAVIHAEPQTRLYRTREEQREAGLKTEITPWLTASGLVEAELSYDDYSIDPGHDDLSGREDSATLQLGLIIDLFSLAEGEVVLEYDTDTDKVEVDEAFVTLEQDPWELSIGRQYTPFGVYFSNFVTGPMLEFGETLAHRAVTLAYGPSDELDMSVTYYRGQARKRGTNADRWDWVFSLESEINETWSVGWSYQSDLADADSLPLEDENNRYSRRVPGMSGYLLWSGEQFEFTFEALAATRSYKEMDSDRNQPWAWNAELVHFLDGYNMELAFRVERSHELEDEPSIRYGPAVTWRIGKHANLTLEYLHGEFKDGLATNDDDLPYDHVDRVGGQFAYEF